MLSPPWQWPRADGGSVHDGDGDGASGTVGVGLGAGLGVGLGDGEGDGDGEAERDGSGSRCQESPRRRLTGGSTVTIRTGSLSWPRRR